MAGAGRWRRAVWMTAAGIGILFVAAQWLHYGRNHTNPRVVREPAWDTPRTRELTARACFDCHSNETRWPWYSNVAPVSWLVQRDVDEGREEVNFSEWGTSLEESGEPAEAVAEGEMPPWYYTPLHPEARLTPEERQALVRGLEATFGLAEQERVGEREHEDAENEHEEEHD
jgi:mono/diheme cytochrome c family protein